MRQLCLLFLCLTFFIELSSNSLLDEIVETLSEEEETQFRDKRQAPVVIPAGPPKAPKPKPIVQPPLPIVSKNQSDKVAPPVPAKAGGKKKGSRRRGGFKKRVIGPVTTLLLATTTVELVTTEEQRNETKSSKPTTPSAKKTEAETTTQTQLATNATETQRPTTTETTSTTTTKLPLTTTEGPKPTTMQTTLATTKVPLTTSERPKPTTTQTMLPTTKVPLTTETETPKPTTTEEISTTTQKPATTETVTMKPTTTETTSTEPPTQLQTEARTKSEIKAKPMVVTIETKEPETTTTETIFETTMTKEEPVKRSKSPSLNSEDPVNADIKDVVINILEIWDTGSIGARCAELTQFCRKVFEWSNQATESESVCPSINTCVELGESHQLPMLEGMVADGLKSVITPLTKREKKVIQRRVEQLSKKIERMVHENKGAKQSNQTKLNVMILRSMQTKINNLK